MMPSLPIALFALLALGGGSPDRATCTTLTVELDTVRHEVVITAGPFVLEDHSNMPDMDHNGMHMAETDMMRFEWPAIGSLRGVDLSLHDASGKPLPTHILHHLAMYNFDRRGLIHRQVERLFAWGQDTRAVVLPSGVAVPLPKGEHLGFLIAWHNDLGYDIKDAYVRMTLPYAKPRDVKLQVFPWYLDVHNVNGGRNSFDLPAGRSSQRLDFQVPLSGRLIAVGGHMHDYALDVRLVDSARRKTLIKLDAERAKNGDVHGTERFIFGFHEDAFPIRAHHTYALVSDYDNTSGQAIADGGMGQLNGIFQPDRPSEWPALDLNDPEVQADLKSLPPDLSCTENVSRVPN